MRVRLDSIYYMLMTTGKLIEVNSFESNRLSRVLSNLIVSEMDRIGDGSWVSDDDIAEITASFYETVQTERPFGVTASQLTVHSVYVKKTRTLNMLVEFDEDPRVVSNSYTLKPH